MVINRTDISYYGAKQMKVTPGKRTVTNESEMAGGLFVPAMCAPEIGLKEYEIVLAVHGESREDIWRRADMIVALFGKRPAVVKLDGFSSTFRLALNGVNQEEYGPNRDRWHTLTLQCRGYEQGEEVVERILTLRYDTAENGIYEDFTCSTSGIISIIPGMRRALMGIKVEQIYVVENGDATNDYRFIGKCAPIRGEIEIGGVCRSRSGESLGAVKITAAGDETSIEIEKGTGIATGHSENGWATNHKGFAVDMPSPPVCIGSGYGPGERQDVTFNMRFFRQNSEEPWVRYRKMRFTFSYTPIYI